MRKRTVVAESARDVLAFCVGCGVGVGLLVPFLADWLVSLPWAPLKGPAELVDSVPEPARTLGTGVVGAVVGLFFGFGALHESLTVTVDDARVGLAVRGEKREFAREEIALAARDGKQLVLLSRTGAELARENCGLPWARLARAFTEHGYRWVDEDPHREQFRRWVPGAAGLPEGANALLHARARALKAKDDASDARELRTELGRLGVIVRDEKDRQYWRLPEP
ncbi:YqeB family protein [Streptomyces antibioticus]|uniref:YqeB family protein n=1 Tax=Streptomyces antibioticus TaxID=1890 RepID=UPI0036C463EC